MQVMVALIDLHAMIGTWVPSGRKQIEFEGKMINTAAIQIIPFPDGVDPNLLNIVCATMSDPDDRPDLRYLYTKTQQAIANPPASYRDNPEESDDAISKLWTDIVHNAPTA